MAVSRACDGVEQLKHMDLLQIQLIPRKRNAPAALLAPLCLIAIAFPLQADGCDFSLRGVDQMCTLTWNNLSRVYLLHVPNSFVPGQSAIVVGLHGSQGSGPTFEGSSLTAKAEPVGFAVAYPSAPCTDQMNLAGAGATAAWGMYRMFNLER